jgi:spore maturation protein CgeB
MVDDSVGGLFKRGEPEDLARCVNEMLASQETAKKAILGRERVLSRYTYEHNASDYVAVFNRAIEKRNGK